VIDRGPVGILPKSRGEHGNAAHRFHTACHHDVIHAGDHSLRREVAGLLAGPAGAVDGN